MDVDEWLVATVVKEQVSQENDQKTVKQTEFQNKQVFHEYWTVPKLWNEEVKWQQQDRKEGQMTYRGYRRNHENNLVSQELRQGWDKEVLGLSMIVNKVSALNWLADETAEVLVRVYVMAWAADNIDLPVEQSWEGIGEWVVEEEVVGGTDMVDYQTREQDLASS